MFFCGMHQVVILKGSHPPNQSLNKLAFYKKCLITKIYAMMKMFLQAVIKSTSAINPKSCECPTIMSSLVFGIREEQLEQ